MAEPASDLPPKTQAEGQVLAFLARHRSAAQVSADVLAWAVGLTLALVGRYDFLPPGQLAGFFVLLPAALALHVLVGVLGRFRHGSSQRTMFTDHVRACT